MKIRFQVVTFDAADIDAEAEFWAGVLGGVVEVDGDWRTVLVDGEPRVGVQQAENYQCPQWPDGVQQQVHLDLWVDDFPAAHEAVTKLGAVVLRAASGVTEGDDFQVYADPAGHPFCLCFFVPANDA
jgi:predicted enzyme related to lactoylglutathione lyase